MTPHFDRLPAEVCLELLRFVDLDDVPALLKASRHFAKAFQKSKKSAMMNILIPNMTLLGIETGLKILRTVQLGGLNNVTIDQITSISIKSRSDLCPLTNDALHFLYRLARRCKPIIDANMAFAPELKEGANWNDRLCWSTVA